MLKLSRRSLLAFLTVIALTITLFSAGIVAGQDSVKGYPPSSVTTPSVGNLPSQVSGDIRSFNLVAEPVVQTILDNVNNKTLQVKAWGFNGSTPGPTIVVTEGETVAITVTNNLSEPTSVHWHGLTVPNSQDGVPEVGEPSPLIQPGQSYTYKFKIVDPPGSHMYHSHTNTSKQDNLGLFGGFIILPKGGIRHDHDYVLFVHSWSVPQDRQMADAGTAEQGPNQGATLDPVSNVTSGTFPENPENGMFNFHLINGKAYPSTESLTVRQGERVRIRFLNVSQFNHPFHIHGQNWQLVARDGFDLQQIETRNSVLAISGGTEDVEFVASNPGVWPLHCHLPHHVTNNGSSGEGGMFTVIKIES